MKIIHKEIDYFIQRLENTKRFALVGFGDAEVFSIIRRNLGATTGLGQVMDGKTGDRLLDVILRRHTDSDFLFSAPGCIWTDQGFRDAHVPDFFEQTVKSYGVDVDLYERDTITDNLAKRGDLYPFIAQLQKMNIVVVGPAPLRGLDFLDYVHFTEISSPNLHMESRGIENAAEDAISYGAPAVYLVSAGVSAPLIIDQIYDHIPNSFFIDCGSIWDAFVGIGGQRGWRAELYENPIALEKWKHDSLYGKS